MMPRSGQPKRFSFHIETNDSNKELIRRWIAFADAGFSGRFLDFIAPDYATYQEARWDVRNSSDSNEYSSPGFQTQRIRLRTWLRRATELYSASSLEACIVARPDRGGEL
jgi:hypothetical protein